MTYTADVSMFPYFKKDEVKTVKKVVVINDTQKKVWRLEAQNEMLRKELEDANRIAEDYSNESFGYEKGYKRLKEENKKLKEEKNKYFGYLKDKDLECEEQRERAEALLVSKNVLHKEVEEQTTTIEQAEDALASLNFYKECNEELKEEIKDHKKTKEELYETIMELKNPVTNYDERCGVLKARFNHAYLMGFMYGHDIDPDVSRSVDESEEFDGVIEHMSKEVEHVIDTYLQDSLIYGTHMTLNEVITDRLDNIIEQAVSDGIVRVEDDSSDED